MKKFLNSSVVPPGGFYFRDPDTGFEYNLQYPTFEKLEQHVTQYRNSMGLPKITSFRQVWEHFICANNPSMRHKCCDADSNVKRNFTQYWSGAKSYVKAALAGKEAFVDRDTAEKRAAICLKCTQNVRNIGHNHAKFYTDKFIQNQVGTRKTSVDDKLFTCNVCSCILRGKVHYSDKIVAESLSTVEIGKLARDPRNVDTGRKLQCWQLKAVLGEDENE